MNNLHRAIQHGEIVIIGREFVEEEFHSDRRFKVESGFGMQSVTTGTALFGEWVSDGEKLRLEGFMIDAAETELYQTQHPTGN